MIRVLYKTDKISSIDKLEDKYYEGLQENRFSKKKIYEHLHMTVDKAKSLESLYNELTKNDYAFKIVFSGLTLEDIILIQAEKIPCLVSCIEDRILSLGVTSQQNFLEKVKILFNYSDKFQSKNITPFFQNYFDFRTCHYCNRTYTTDLSIEKKASKQVIVTYQLDHFYEKAHYPYLALSFYNFIPCCSTCNATIKNRAINKKEDDCFFKNCIAPNREDFDFHKQVKFTTFFTNNTISMNKIDDFDIFLKERMGQKYRRYIEIFKLNERYASHKDFIFEMIKKRQKYPDSMLREISVLTKQTIEKVKQDIFGIELYDEDLLKEPLSKLKQDIARELGLI